MKRTCICNICNCGRHQCSQTRTTLYVKADQPHMRTEYSEKYPCYGILQPARSLKPRLEYQEKRGKMDGSTTFKSDYVPYEVMPQYVRQQADYKPNPGEMDLGTTYKLDFGAHEVQPFVPQRPVERSYRKPGKLDVLPTYTEDFRPWEVSKREMTKPDFTYRPPPGKFGNATTFQDDYVPRGLVPRQSFKPLGLARLSDVPFDANTSHRMAFVPHAVEPRVPKPVEEYVPSSEPFQDHTTQRADFQGLPGQPPRSCKPDVAKATSDARIESRTEFRDSFKQWPLALPQLPKAREYMGPTEHMDLNTTTKGDFVRHQVQPFIPVKPPSRSRKPLGPFFQGSTTTKEDFQPWQVQRKEMITRREEAQKASGKMEDLTTFKLHYTPHQIQPSLSFKPRCSPLKTEAPFEESTMYRTEFTPKKMNMCPASFDCPPGYVFEDNHQGHRCFRKLLPPDRNGMPVSSTAEVAVMS